MKLPLLSIIACVLASIAMAGMVASTTNDLGPLTVLTIPAGLQIPGIVLIGFLLGLTMRTAAAGTIALLVVSVAGAIMQGMAIAAGGFENDTAAVFLFNRGTVQGFYALILIFFFGMVGIVGAMLVNVFARRLDI